MKITGLMEVEGIVDVRCDVCGTSTFIVGSGYQFGILQAHWGYGTGHDGERHEIHLCERCFFQTLANLKEERRGQHMFSKDAPDFSSDLGLVVRDDFFKDSDH